MTVTVTDVFEQVVAAEIRAQTARLGLNQARLAELMGENEIWVSRRLRGKVHLTMGDVARFATALRCSIHTLVPEPEDVEETFFPGGVTQKYEQAAA